MGSDQMKSVFQQVYNAEINFNVYCLWDAGFTVELIDYFGNATDSIEADTWSEVEEALLELVKRNYIEFKLEDDNNV
jgi:hypothetical protein